MGGRPGGTQRRRSQERGGAEAGHRRGALPQGPAQNRDARRGAQLRAADRKRVVHGRPARNGRHARESVRRAGGSIRFGA